MSLNLLIGYTGLVSFGHSAFFAFGGYAFGLLLQSPDFTASFGAASVPVAFAAAVVATAVYSAIIGAICVRLTEIYFAFLTLAFQMFLYSVILTAVTLTARDQGLMGGIPRPPFHGIYLRSQYTRNSSFAVVFSVFT